ncbi:vWA domain-containing protein [Okeania sp. SIO1I7]|uniref:vWA domain-containing protein n=1 Tax=Okeania sp. SIO1I7 TaxID=2607772 RepID=UPI0013F7A6F9|nr:vWA domain-containing protein [Okeania sp. SIO1I7]NET30019.1 VWA domain-containing protein [Okeania sp. SIO1I7]
MIMNLQNFTQKLPKPILFGIFGGAGCLIAAAIFGEIWLSVTRRPPKLQAVVLLIDTSSSMGSGKLSEVQAAATGFVDRQNLTVNKLAIVEFSSNSRVLTNFDADETELKQAIANLRPSGSTNLSQGLNTVASLLQNRNAPNILLFTDGQPNNPGASESMAQQIRATGINLVAVGTGDADSNYLTSLTGNPNLVFFANSGGIDQAFRSAERAIQQLSDKGGDYGLVFGTFRIGVWTGFLALGIGLALIVGQNYNLRRRLLSSQEIALGSGSGFLAGMVGGTIGQLAFLPTANLPILAIVARMTGWTFLGTLVGGGMSLFVPNLPRDKAFFAGGLGGVLGATCFLLLDAVVGVIPARLAGAAVLGFCIGLAIALSEQLDREAVLLVRWSNSESTTISLGKEPIELGSSRNAHVYLSRDAGFPAKFAKMFIDEGKVILEFDPSIQEHPKFQSMKVLKQELLDGSSRKFGDVLLEIKQKNILK